MSTREDRYGAAMVLAHEILDGPPEEDGRRLAEAVADLTGELVAGRKNQQEFPDIAARVRNELDAMPGFSVKVRTQPSLHVVRENG